MLVALASTLAVLTGPSAQAEVNLVANGSFEQLKVANTSSEFGDRQSSQQVTGWSTGGYNFVFTPGTADTAGAIQGSSMLKLWGPGDGSANGLPATSPDGGNYIAADGAYEVGAITQTINGLTPGDAVVVSFWYGGAQQYNFTGANTEGWTVSLGAQSQSTPVLQNASHGFTGWAKQTMTFVASSTSELLQFLPVGTPTGQPPFSLLDGVTVTTPEPATWTILLAGTLGLLGITRRRRGTGRKPASRE